MRILCTNDDGIHATGLAVLERIARHFSDDVWVIAPETEQSGASRELTLTAPIRVRQALKFCLRAQRLKARLFLTSVPPGFVRVRPRRPVRP